MEREGKEMKQAVAVGLSLSMLEWKTSFVKRRFAWDFNIIKYICTTQVDLQSL